MGYAGEGGFSVSLQNAIGNSVYGSLGEAPLTYATRREKEEAKKNLARRKESSAKAHLEYFKKHGDIDKIKALADKNDHVVECELCGDWFYKKSVSDEDVCDTCNDEKTITAQKGKKSNHFKCQWCGKDFQRNERWCSTKFCCEDCREVELEVRVRERNRALRCQKRDRDEAARFQSAIERERKSHRSLEKEIARLEALREKQKWVDGGCANAQTDRENKAEAVRISKATDKTVYVLQESRSEKFVSISADDRLVLTESLMDAITFGNVDSGIRALEDLTGNVLNAESAKWVLRLCRFCNGKIR